MEKTEFRIDSLLNEIVNITAFSVSQKGIDFSIEISESIDFDVIGDSLRLQQVLLNLTSNAIKFTHEGGVLVCADVQKRHENTAELIFSVKDTGIGMTPEQTSHIFDAFGQADSSTTRKYGGTGLGLAISKSIVEMMSGRIWLDSTPGIGTTFFFTVALEIIEASSLPETDSADTDEYAIPQELLGARVLLAEDNEINQLIANELLSNAGFNVHFANNGEEAVNMAEKNEYDLILMDIQMPVMDGLTAAGIIRSNNRFNHIPILAMTANAMQGDRDRSIQAGMDDHITKPLIPKQMMGTICYWLSHPR